ncbi:Tfp pilus assembly protein PilW [Solimonas aquatica]|uniref:Tfp pilus assembly protein PilW n=1 Tax=Solimonas aquatica TaxID=489703 RepID=A0A1H9FR88_9GAMM|nr:PilW family protein [Solimonas aquatica]SEQ40417.1 Tfp pilus assembly protein PilW [Solimonas aquatica]
MNGRQRGYSLLEVLAALSAATLLGLALTQLLVLEQRLWRSQQAGARQQDNARTALELLARAIRSADSWGGVEAGAIRVAANLHPAGRSGAKACTGDWIADPLDAVHGFDGGAAPPFDCLSGSDYRRDSDMLALKSVDADGLSTTQPGGNAAGIWLRVAAGGGAYLFAAGDWSAAQAAVPAQNAADHGVYQLPYRVAVYALRPCSVQNSSGQCSSKADGGQPIPTLVAIQLTSAGNLEEKPLVENIEQLQFDYGLDSDGDRRPDRYLAAAAVSDWSRVCSVRVGLIARADWRSGSRDTRRYALPGAYQYQASGAEQLWSRQVYSRELTLRSRRAP